MGMVIEEEQSAIADMPASTSPPPPPMALSSPAALPQRPVPAPSPPASSVSRPTSAASRPGSSHGSAERVSCYQCYKQVLPKFAFCIEDTSGNAANRQFCSEACSDAFQRVLQARLAREQQLSELRAAVLEEEKAQGRC